MEYQGLPFSQLLLTVLIWPLYSFNLFVCMLGFLFVLFHFEMK